MDLRKYRIDREEFLNNLGDFSSLVEIESVRKYLGINNSILEEKSKEEIDKIIENKVNSLSEVDKINLLELKQIELDKYLRSFVRNDGLQRQGPLTGYISLDKPFLKSYSEEMLDHITPHMSIYDYMIKSNKNSNDMAIYYFGNRMTYKQFDKFIDECVKSLINIGVKESDIVTLCMANTPETLALFYALNKIGAIANMLHPLSSELEIRDSLNITDSKIIFTIDSSYQKLLNIVDDTKLEHIVTVSPANSMSLVIKNLFRFTKEYVKVNKDKRHISFKKFIQLGRKQEINIDNTYHPDRTSVILYTGGTTGPSKGVALTDDNFNSMVDQFLTSINKFERGDHVLAVMPVFHGFGLCSSMHLPLAKGVSINMIPKLQKDKIVGYFKSNNVSCVIGVPTLFEAIINTVETNLTDKEIKKYFASVKMFVVGGDVNSVRDKIKSFCLKYNLNIEICDGYGLTEAVAGVTFSSNGYNKENTIGIPMVKTNVKIVDPITREELPNKEVGEMAFSGPSIMKCYYNNEKSTNKVLDNNWLYTGDIGSIDDDNLIRFEQRKNDMIITSGYNVYPNKVRSVVMEHPLVKDCVVIGGYHSYKKEIPIAYIILERELSKEMIELIKEEILCLCRKKLSGWEIPYNIIDIDCFPKTKMEKVDKEKLKRMYLDYTSQFKVKTKTRRR